MEFSRNATAENRCAKPDDLQVVHNDLSRVGRTIDKQIARLERISKSVFIPYSEMDLETADGGVENGYTFGQITHQNKKITWSKYEYMTQSKHANTPKLEKSSRNADVKIADLCSQNAQLQRELEKEKKRAEHFKKLSDEKDSQIEFLRTQLQLLEKVTGFQST